jgi:response regulator RpfG family c-di-GMP phosphodiesterase
MTVEKHISEELQLHNSWQYELGAMLSQIGCITLPNNVRNKVYSQQPLSEKEQSLFDSHPSIGGRLLENVPRLESIAKMIENQLLPYKDYEVSDDSNKHEDVDFGAQILKVAIDFDRLTENGVSGKDIISKMRSLPKIYNTEIVETLVNLVKSEETKQREDTIRSISVNELEVGMVAGEDVFTSNGAKVLSKGSEITHPALICLSKFAEGVGVEEPFKVRFCHRKHQLNN